MYTQPMLIMFLFFLDQTGWPSLQGMALYAQHQTQHSQPAEHLSLSSISYTCCIHVYVLYEWEDVLDNKT